MILTQSNFPALQKKVHALLWQENLAFYLKTLAPLLLALSATGILFFYYNPISYVPALALTAFFGWLLCDYHYWKIYLTRATMGGKLLDPKLLYHAKACLTSYFFQTCLLILTASAFYQNFVWLGKLSSLAHPLGYMLLLILFLSALTAHVRMTTNYSALVRSPSPIQLAILKNQNTSRLSSWVSMHQAFKLNPLSFIHTSKTASKLLEYYPRLALSNRDPMPLELALGFMDPEIFKECLQCYDRRSTDYKETHQQSLDLISPVLALPKKLDATSFGILQTIDKILQSQPPLPGSGSFSSISSSDPSFFRPSHSNKKTSNPPLYNHNPKYAASITSTISASPSSVRKISLPKFGRGVPPELSKSTFPSLANTLRHIPLPTCKQLAHLSISHSQSRWLGYAGFTTGNTARIHSIPKRTLSAFAALTPDDYTTFRQAIHTLVDAIQTSAANNVFWPGKLSHTHARITLLTRLSVRFCRYYVQLHNALLASISLNSPGKKYSIRLHKKTSLRKPLYLGITLAGRAVKLAQDFQTLLETIRNTLSQSWLTDPGRSTLMEITQVSSLCQTLEKNVFSYISQLSTGSTMPRFYLLHGNYEGCKHDVLSNHPKFSSLFSTCYSFYSDDIHQVPRLVSKAPLPTEKDVIAYLSDKSYPFAPDLERALLLWKSQASPKLPTWFHCTRHCGKFISILQSGVIQVNHNIYSGAFISTQIENTVFGNYVFAFSKETPLMSETYNKTKSTSTIIWHGCRQPISLAANLVAIGYPDEYDGPHQAGPIISELSKVGTVYLQNERLAFLQFQNVVIPLFSCANLIGIHARIMNGYTSLTKKFDNWVTPLPPHLMLRRTPNLHSCRDKKEEDCLPLDQQISNCRTCIPTIPNM